MGFPEHVAVDTKRETLEISCAVGRDSMIDEFVFATHCPQ